MADQTSGWCPAREAPPEHRSQVAELLEFGLVQFRARTKVSIDYEPDALASREAEIAARTERERADFKRELERDPNAVQNINPMPFHALGTKPWLQGVPLARTITSDVTIRADELSQLSADQWADLWNRGRVALVDPQDERRRRMFDGIEFRLELELSGRDLLDELGETNLNSAPEAEPRARQATEWIRQYSGNNGRDAWAKYSREVPNHAPRKVFERDWQSEKKNPQGRPKRAQSSVEKSPPTKK